MIKQLFIFLCFLPIFLAAQVQVFNAGIGGHNTKNGLSRISNLLKQYKPTILVIGFLAFAAFFLVGGTIATIIDTIRNFLKK